MKQQMINEMTLRFVSRSANEAFARAAAAAFVAQLDPTVEQVYDIKTAVSEAVTVSVRAIFPESTASIISSMVMTLVTLAGARRSWELDSYRMVPVATSISTALFPATSSAAADTGSANRHSDRISAAAHIIRFIIIPPNDS